MLVLSAFAFATTFTATVGSDSRDVLPGDGLCADPYGRCTLRAALMEANATPEADVIELDGSLGSHQLGILGAGEDGAETGDLDIAAPVSFVADGVWVAGALEDRVFHVLPSVVGEVRFSGVNVAWGFVAGDDGAGILVDGADAEWPRCGYGRGHGGVSYGGGPLRGRRGAGHDRGLPALLERPGRRRLGGR